MIRVICLAFVVGAVHVEAQNTPRSTISGEPISADRMEIYQDFLVYYQDQNSSKAAFTLNLAQTTVPFEEHGGDRLLCLKQFKPEELVSSSLHMFRMTAAFQSGLSIQRSTRFKIPETPSERENLLMMQSLPALRPRYLPSQRLSLMRAILMQPSATRSTAVCCAGTGELSCTS
jgi:hypothetical protein